MGLVAEPVSVMQSQDSQEDVMIDVEVEEVEEGDLDHHDSQMVSQMSEDEVDDSQPVGVG